MYGRIQNLVHLLLALHRLWTTQPSCLPSHQDTLPEILARIFKEIGAKDTTEKCLRLHTIWEGKVSDPQKQIKQ